MAAWRPSNRSTLLKIVETNRALAGTALLREGRLLKDDNGAATQRTPLEASRLWIDQIVQVLTQWDKNPMQHVELCWIDYVSGKPVAEDCAEKIPGILRIILSRHQYEAHSNDAPDCTNEKDRGIEFVNMTWCVQYSEVVGGVERPMQEIRIEPSGPEDKGQYEIEEQSHDPPRRKKRTVAARSCQHGPPHGLEAGDREAKSV